MSDLSRRFRSLDRLEAPELWPDILSRELAFQDRRPLRRGLLLAAATIAIGLFAAMAAMALLRSPASDVGNEGLPDPQTSPTSATREQRESFDPTYVEWSATAQGSPGLLIHEESGPPGLRAELRAEWVDGKLCYIWLTRPGTGWGNCAAWSELIDRSAWLAYPWSTGPLRYVGAASWTVGDAWHHDFIVLSEDVVAVTVRLASGEVLEPELIDLPIGPNGERARWVWVRTAENLAEVTATDLAGLPVVSGP